MKKHCTLLALVAALLLPWAVQAQGSCTLSVPHTEGFETTNGTAYSTAGVVPTCWSAYSNGTGAAYVPHVTSGGGTYSYYHTGSKSLVMTSGNASYGNTKHVVLPEFSQPVNQLQISFWMCTESAANGVLSVGYMTSATDTSTFVAVQDFPACSATVHSGNGLQAAGKGAIYEVVLSQVPANAARIAFRWSFTSTTYYSCCIDDVTVENIPACPKPDNLTASNITSSAADISWTEMGSATSWVLEYHNASFTPGAGIGTVESATTTNVSLSQLSSNTTYYVAVRSNCGGGDTSYYRTSTFRTTCAELTAADFPYTEDFEAYGTGSTQPISPCWTKGTNNGIQYPYPYATNAISGTRSLYFYCTHTSTTSNYCYAALPPVDASINVNTLQLTFDARRFSSTTAPYHSAIVVGVMTDPNDISTFDTVRVIDITNEASLSIHHFDVPLTQYQGTGVYVALYSPSPEFSGSAVYNGIYIDNVELAPTPSCPRPADMVASNVTPTTADISWSELGTATSWVVEYSTNAAFTPGAGQGTLISANDTSVTLTGLISDTRYYVYIHSDCGGGDTSYNLASHFRTACAPLTSANLPYTEDFEDYGTGATQSISPCWTKGTSSATAYPYPYASNAISGTRSLYFFGSKSTSANNYSWAALPPISEDLEMSNLMVEFKARRHPTTTAAYHSVIIVGIADSLSDLQSFVPIDTIDLTSEPSLTITSEVITFANYQGEGRYVVFYAPAPENSTSTLHYNYIYIDDITLSEISNCMRPIDFAVNSVTPNSATISWSEIGSATSWTIEYDSTDFLPGTGIGFVETANDTTFTLTNLEPNTVYHVYIHGNCGGDTSLNLAGTLRTACAAIPTDSLPYIEDFESYTSGASNPISPCWTRHSFGNATTYPYPNTTAAINGNIGLYCYSNTSSTLGATPIYEYATLPTFEAPINTLSLRLNSKRYSATGTNYKSCFYVGVMSNPNDLSTFDTVAFIDRTDLPASTITAEEIWFDQYQGTGTYITILIPAPGAGQYNYIYLDDVAVDVIPTCRRSDGLTASNITTSSADLSWHNSSEDPVYGYVVALSTQPGFNPDTCQNLYDASDTTLGVNGLSTYTNYYWSVRTLCGTDSSEWSNIATFKTAFDCGEGNVANILDTIGEGTGSGYTYYMYNYMTYPQAYSAHIYTAAELAAMGLQTNNRINSLSFHYGATGGTNTDVTILMKETDYDAFPSSLPANDTADLFSGMTQVFHGSITGAPQQWTEVMLDSAFAYSGTRNLLIRLVRTSAPSASATTYYSNLSPDRLTVYGYRTAATTANFTCTSATTRLDVAFNVCTTIPSCERPENVAIADLQSTSARFAWTGTASSYEVAYGPQGFDPDSTEGTHTTLVADSILLTGLTPMTGYDFYVRSRCTNPTDTSNWTLPYSFTTPCQPQTLPYTEDFESYGSGATATISPCWTKAVIGTATQYPYPYATNAITGLRSLYFYALHSASAAYASYAALPLMAAPVDSLSVSFNMRRYSSTTDAYTSRLVVGLMTDPSDITTFTPVDTIDMKDEPALAIRGFEVNFAGHTQDGQFICFYDEAPPFYGTATSSYSYLYLDDIVVDYIPTCPRVLDVIVADSTITGTSAVVSWTDRVTPANGYELEYGPAGFELGTGTHVTSTTNPTTLTGLAGSTNYEVYVRPICSATDSGQWSFAATFATSCLPISQMPFVMDFEDAATGTSAEMPLCWTRFNNASSTYNYYPYINSSASFAHSGTKYLYFYGSTTTTYAENQIMSLPQIDTNVIPMNTLELHFWGRSSTTASYASQLIVGVMSDPNMLSTFQVLDTINMTTTYTEYVVNFANYHGNGSYVSLRLDRLASYNYAYVDDITLQQVPDCPSVYDIALAAIDSNSMTITWSDSVGLAWTVEYGPEGFTPGTGTTVSTVTDSLTVFGLTPSTRYTFSITPACSGLVYAASATFRTAANYLNTPFVCDFEDTTMQANWVLENGTNNNAWTFGSATSNGGTRGLYVSKDHGTHNNYEVTSAGVSYAYVDLNLPAGDYEYSFDWKAQGESIYDYLRVALIPVSEDLEAINGTAVPTGMSASTVPASWISLHGTGKLNLDSTWNTIADVMTLAQGGIYHLAFVWRNDGSSGSQPPAAIDNVVFNRVTCSRPANLTASNITTTSADISWTETGGATQWLYILDGGVEQHVTTTNISLSNLTSSTVHHFQVRSFCAIGDTSYAADLYFATLCDLASAVDTFREDFEFYTGTTYNTEGVLPNCWEGYFDGTNNNYFPHIVGSGTYWYTASGSNSLMMTSGATTYGATKVVRLPQFAEPVNSLTLSYWMCTESSSLGTLSVGYLTGDNLATDFVAIKSIPASSATMHSGTGLQPNSGVFDTVSFEDVPDSALYIAFKWDVSSTSYYSCAVDDITVTADIPCPAPVITSVTHDFESADITWSGNGSTYQVQIRSLEGSYGQPVTVNANSYRFTGLTPATSYMFQVRQDCSADSLGFSTWAEGTFLTDSMPCLPPTQFANTAVTNSTATFAWTPGSTETGWEIHVFNNTFEQFYEVIDNPTTVTGLTAGVTYNAAIRALCGADYSIFGDYGDTIQFVTAICDPVTNVTATADGLSITVTWTPGANNCGNFEIEYGGHGFGQGEGTTVAVSGNSHTFNGLEELTQYDFYVRAVCAEGWTSAWSSLVTATTGQATGDECYVPTNVTASANGTSISVTWTAATGNTGDYEVEYGEEGFAQGQGTTAQVSDESFTVNDLAAATTYDFYVRALCTNQTYSDWSEVASATTGQIGIDDVDGNFSCTIFPNPATDETTISVSGVNGQVTVAVVDMNGRIVSAETLDCAADCVKKVNVSGLAQGAYFVRITGDSVNSVKKLIVR